MNNANSEEKVLVQVVPVDEGREIGWGAALPSGYGTGWRISVVPFRKGQRQ